MKIGIYGGSFNPIHFGHIGLVKWVAEHSDLDEVWLMVSPQNPLKQGSSDLLDDQLRYQLARLALHGEEGIVASNYELHLPKPSYTWNTLERLRQDFPQHTFLLLIGGDNWQHFHRWYRADDIVREYQIVVYPRRGSDIDRTTLPSSVRIVDTELIDVSSTEIRECVRRGEPVGTMVPKAIEPLARKLYLNFS